ncbi:MULTISPECIES: hypothetical protein [Burkholderia]|uniref:Swt1-like HEPN domain-containing protein n=1 Tax=Burkholderia pyrrocinia TaxID=60550 RepID=A0A318IRZ9_BURPY|nr:MULTISPECIES: hypothetical protein [Burkholderia]PXX38269.1 hypothetical protein NA66_1003247 [Burkholderia pyrrocinia]SFW54597.1 hypothetical protein SAMN03159384_02789 [Burkholderia sp. NFACC33-1]SFX54959.1 hypothetical protein SAMN03159408_01570 [Burkholderia sp. NFPP32]
MALHLLDSNDVHNACRQRLETCELWLRRIIHDKLSAQFGADYIDGAILAGQPIFSQKAKDTAQKFSEKNPTQYSRPIDALLLDDLGAVLAKQEPYNNFFKDAFEQEFPWGKDHIRRIIKVLIPIRNALSHANGPTQSIHDLERALCYSSDIVKSLKIYYSKMAKNEKFPAPVFIRFSDNMGTLVYPAEAQFHYNVDAYSLHVEDEIRFEVEVDSSFSPSEYEIKWVVNNIYPAESGVGTSFNLKLTPRHVGEKFGLQVSLTTTNNEWHRFQNVDAYLTLNYEVLPTPR